MYTADPELSEAGCRAIYGLRALNQLLNDCNVCSHVLNVITQHPNNAQVAQWVCRAIGKLRLVLTVFRHLFNNTIGVLVVLLQILRFVVVQYLALLMSLHFDNAV